MLLLLFISVGTMDNLAGSEGDAIIIMIDEAVKVDKDGKAHLCCILIRFRICLSPCRPVNHDLFATTGVSRKLHHP